MYRLAIIIITLTVLHWNFGISQNEIEVPNFEYVQVDYDLRDYVSISVNKMGEIKIENKKINLGQLKQNLFQELSRKAKFEGLRLPISIIELIADKELEYEKLKPLLIELRKLNFLKIHFVSNSENEKKIEGLKTTGFLYKLSSMADSKSIIFEVKDSLNSELEKIMNKKGVNIEEFKKSQIPPPPPLPEITAKDLKNGEINIQVKEVIITNEYFIIENQKYTSMELRNQITKWNSEKPIAYIINPSNDCHYEKFLTPISEIKRVLNLLWEMESVKEFGKEFESLDYEEKNKIKHKYPFIMVIED